MKWKIRIISLSAIAIGMFLLTNESCENEPDPVGTCFIYCSCGDCGDDLTYGGLTRKTCEDKFNEENAKSECTCGCSWDWAQY